MIKNILPFIVIITACTHQNNSIANYYALEEILQNCDCSIDLDSLDIKYSNEKYLVLDSDIKQTCAVNRYKEIWDKKADLRRIVSKFELAERLDSSDAYLEILEHDFIMSDTIRVPSIDTSGFHYLINSFDKRCLFLASVQYQECSDSKKHINILAEIIESKRYSPYLIDVFLKWRSFAQMAVFGPSTWTCIPNSWYDKVRGICANTILRHLQSCPNDKVARYQLYQLVEIGPLYRFGNPFGNSSMNL